MKKQYIQPSVEVELMEVELPIAASGELNVFDEENGLIGGEGSDIDFLSNTRDLF